MLVYGSKEFIFATFSGECRSAFIEHPRKNHQIPYTNAKTARRALSEVGNWNWRFIRVISSFYVCAVERRSSDEQILQFRITEGLSQDGARVASLEELFRYFGRLIPDHLQYASTRAQAANAQA